jgi:hypothetical protein
MKKKTKSVYAERRQRIFAIKAKMLADIFGDAKSLPPPPAKKGRSV